MRQLLAILLIAVAFDHSMQGSVYQERFMTQYNKIHNKDNGYFSQDGIPYHAVETLIVEAPDHGHQTTSEAYSYYIWLESMYGGFTKNFSSFNTAWRTMERYMIPTSADQSTNNAYNPWAPATYMAEWDIPDEYPSQIRFDVPTGKDVICQELKDAYGTPNIYLMHWLSDVDNIYGFGNVPGGICEGGPNAGGPSYINTFQRGPMESVWRTIPQTTCDSFKYGGRNGFLDLYVRDNSYAQQWKYTAAPDADARAIQAAFWAHKWAEEQGTTSQVEETLSKAAKLGDYLRYALYDKYFKRVGNCTNEQSCPGGNGKESAHYLISWYMAWGGALYGGWAWRIGDGAAHFGYQNPLTAYALSQTDYLAPKSATGKEDWANSLNRQLELYEFLQSNEGAFSGGVTNSWKGRYADPPDELKQNTFHGMFYDWEPVYHNPPSNRWYGMQGWSVDRLAQYYYVSGSDKAKAILAKWVDWVIREAKFEDNTFKLPQNLEWSGAPPNVDVKVSTYATDVGTASSTARALSYYAAKANDSKAKEVAKKLLDGIWQYQDNIGVTAPETMDTYSQFEEKVYVPPGWTGSYPNGDQINSNSTFISMRSFYKQDKDWGKVEAYLKGGPAPVFNYHRFWTQSEVALAQGAYGMLFNE